MKSQIEKTESARCSVEAIADYFDGELSPQAEIDLELHLGECRFCHREFDLHKKFLSALENDPEDVPELPPDFTKKIVARAESGVEGLRRRDERARAIFICAALFLLVVLGLGNEIGGVFAAFGSFLNQSIAIGGVLVHFVFDFTVGLTIIFKFISHQFSPEAFFAVLIFAAFAVLGLLFISREKLEFGRS